MTSPGGPWEAGLHSHQSRDKWSETSENRHNEKYLQEVQEVLGLLFLPLDQILPKHSETRNMQEGLAHQKQVVRFIYILSVL